MTGKGVGLYVRWTCPRTELLKDPVSYQIRSEIEERTKVDATQTPPLTLTTILWLHSRDEAGMLVHKTFAQYRSSFA